MINMLFIKTYQNFEDYRNEKTDSENILSLVDTYGIVNIQISLRLGL